jgi:tRNA U34 5-carboxymethylaminomethyl modifying GTPase MnmE/TrmE
VLSLFTRDIQPVENIEFKSKINVFTKADLHTPKSQNYSSVAVSSITGKGLKKLNELIKENLLGSTLYSGDAFINTERQRNAIASCHSSLGRALKETSLTPPIFEIAAHEARTAIDSLDSFLGTTTTDEILDGVFSSFCVGK